MVIGGVIGLAIALFLSTIVANTPVVVVSENFRWLYLVAGSSGALAGFTIESMRQLQQSSPDPAYHQRPHGPSRARPSSRPSHHDRVDL